MKMASREVERLIADLRGGDAVRRETAIARLRILGPRVAARLVPLITSDHDPQTRIGALSALEGVADARVVDVALAALGSGDGEVAVAATGVLRGWLAREEGTRVLEAISAAALDRQRDVAVRRAALDALAELPPSLVQPIFEEARLGDAGPVATDAASVHEWIATHGPTAPLSHLHQIIEAIRDSERAEQSDLARQQWLTARGAAHAALAQRGSRVAVYDLRETFDAARCALPLDFLAAVTAIGDASCLEPMAKAWAAAPHDAWWRQRLCEAAADIMHRTRLSGRSAVVKRIRARWSGFV